MTFTGRRLDDETGLFYYRNRYYHAQLGRFVSRDPIGYKGSEWNLYEYVASAPTAGTDPDGLTGPGCCGAGRVYYKPRRCVNGCDINKMLQEREETWWGLIFGGYTYPRGEGNTGNAMAHCVQACKLHQQMPECDDIWEGSEFKKRGDPSSGVKNWQSEIDLRNNAIGRGIVGDCYRGCAEALKNGKLKCSEDDGKTTSACK